MLNTKTISRAEALAILAKQDETRCDVYCLPDVVIAIVGKQWMLAHEELIAMERDGLVTIRLEYVPCPPMGERIPPIRHISLTDAGRAAVVEASA